MQRGSTKRWMGAFLCATGIVYAAPVNADEGVLPIASEAADAPAAPVDLFSDEPAEILPAGQTVNVGSFGEIDLHVKDLELTKVLQLLSIQSQRNIIASRGVAGSVSADLYGVDFYQALDAILQPNGFGFQEKGQFIYVYTAQELNEIEKRERKQVSKIIRLNYINAADASTFVQPLLSDNGSISVSGETKEGFQASVSDGGANSFAHADTLVIRDYQENVDEINAVLGELDVRPEQILVEATVLQAALTETNAFGVDISVLVDYDMSNFAGSPTNIIDKLVGGTVEGGGSVNGAIGSGGGVQTGVGNTNTPGGFKVGVVGDNVSAFVRALDNVTDTTVLANPKLLVLNRQKADLMVGERLGYLSTTQTETAATQTVEFLDVGTQLSVRPFASSDGMVRMELRPSLSDGNTGRVENGFIIPSETTQEMTTNVIVRSGQTVVLGGLFKEDVTVGRRQVPGLGDVPFLGAAFKGQDDSAERSEVIFLIKPTVMKDQSLYAVGESTKNDAQLAVLGARKGLLPWSRTKLTSSQLTKAQQHLERGDKEKALWATNLALYLDPTLTDAMRMKEEITGVEYEYHNFSIMEAALNDAVDEAVNSQLPDLDPMGEAPATEAAPAGSVDGGEVIESVSPNVEVVAVEAVEPVEAFSAGVEVVFEGEPQVEMAGTVNVFEVVDSVFTGGDETFDMMSSVDVELE